ncbi:MAG TPA: hypothetical protein VNS79_03005 [Sphingobium sp.]|nr:hypothetical protein [Sphingobium sp.]
MAGAKLGPWHGAELRKTADAFSGDGSDNDLPEEVRFARGVGRLLLKRIRSVGATMRRDAISVFLLHPDGIASVPAKREPMLGDGGVEVAGRIWFVSETAQSGKSIEPPSIDAGAVFDHVAELGLGAVPAVAFNPTVEPPTLRYYPRGLNDHHNPEVIEINDIEVTAERIETIIERLWEACFITPDAQISGGSDVWADASQHWAASNAEAVVQAHIKAALAIGLVDCTIRDEQPTVAGRVDIEIERKDPVDPSKWSRPFEIEVKVLRHAGRTGRKTSAKLIQWWIKRGIRQAAAYRDARNAENGMLCCFDMRNSDHGDDYADNDNKAFAATHNVTMVRKFLYNDAEALRVARYGS